MRIERSARPPPSPRHDTHPSPSPSPTPSPPAAPAHPLAPAAPRLVVANHMHRRASAEHWLIVSSRRADEFGLPFDEGLTEISKARLLDAPGQPTSSSIKLTLLENVRRLRAEGYHIVLCIDKGPQTALFEPTPAQLENGYRRGEYDRYSGLYCDKEGIRTPPASEGQAYATQVVFHRPVTETEEPWWPMHGIIFVQGRAETAEQADAQWVYGKWTPRSPAVAAAAELSYEEVSTLAGWFCVWLVVLVLGLVGGCCACRKRRAAKAAGARAASRASTRSIGDEGVGYDLRRLEGLDEVKSAPKQVELSPSAGVDRA